MYYFIIIIINELVCSANILSYLPIAPTLTKKKIA